ncbi:formin-like protein 18 [Strigops habroptila]|uniref:formin-like protein 18 n=1 Tax=Strigops habroptila TaxID=2489341 RepID=UPI0011CF09FD|nr:formin-like protein 18 [Strigops habroptila]
MRPPTIELKFTILGTNLRLSNSSASYSKARVLGNTGSSEKLNRVSFSKSSTGAITCALYPHSLPEKKRGNYNLKAISAALYTRGSGGRAEAVPRRPYLGAGSPCRGALGGCSHRPSEASPKRTRRARDAAGSADTAPAVPPAPQGPREQLQAARGSPHRHGGRCKRPKPCKLPPPARSGSPHPPLPPQPSSAPPLPTHRAPAAAAASLALPARTDPPWRCRRSQHGRWESPRHVKGQRAGGGLSATVPPGPALCPPATRSRPVPRRAERGQRQASGRADLRFTAEAAPVRMCDCVFNSPLDFQMSLKIVSSSLALRTAWEKIY